MISLSVVLLAGFLEANLHAPNSERDHPYDAVEEGFSHPPGS